MIDLLGRQSEETKLRETIEDLKETIKSTYQRQVHERVHGGVQGAGHMGSSFFNTLGLTGIAKNIKDKAEAKELDRQGKEAFVQKFQEGNNTFTGTTARGIAETQYEQNKQNPATEEAAIEQKQAQSDALEVQKKSSDDLTALFTISDDYFKAQMKHNEEVKKLFEKISDNGTGGGGGSLLGSAAELAGDLMGSKKGGVGKAGRAINMAGKLGTAAKVGGGLLAVGTAAYEGYSDYQAANEKVASGEITQKEGQVEKGKAVGGGVGAAGGALAGAAAGAALGSVVPVVGTAIGGLIGGAVGYWGGKKAGQAVGGAGVQGYQALTSDGKPAPAAPVAAPGSKTSTQYETVADEVVTKGKPLSAKQVAVVDAAVSMGNKPSPLVQESYDLAKKEMQPAASPKAPTAARTSLAGAAMAATIAVTPAAAAEKIPEAMPSKPALVAPAVSAGNAAAPTGEYDNRSALTGFTKEFLQGIVSGSISGPINKQQAAEYLEKIPPGEMGYKKRFMRGKPVIDAVPSEPSSGSAISSSSTEVSAARESPNSGSTVNSVNAPVSNTVVNNSTTSPEKSSTNNESSFQKYIDRRYYP